MNARLLPFGRRAVLVELPGQDDVHGVWRAIRRRVQDAGSAFHGAEEVVAGARTVLVVFGSDRRVDLEDLPAAVHELSPDAETVGVEGSEGPRSLTIPVCYDGQDIDEVAALTGLSRAEVVRRHQAATYTVAFLGFAPGFAYLSGGDPALTVPRRTTPRTRVPGGAVALAGEMCAVYPVASPGGWQLIGRTNAVVFDAERDPPSLWQPGDRIRFRSVPADELAGEAAGTRPVVKSAAAGAAVEVVSGGALTTIQDNGRVGWAHLGVPRAGPVDRRSAAAANQLVGNQVGGRGAPAVLEATLGGPELRFGASALVALAGAPSDASVDGLAVKTWPCVVPAGGFLRVGDCRGGLRTYVAVAGGWDAPTVLGSRSTDTLSGLGPPVVRSGATLGFGGQAEPPVRLETEFGGQPEWREEDMHQPLTLRVLPGPRSDWLDADPDRALARLCDPSQTEWEVDHRSDRTGVRLSGPPAPPRRDGNLPSEGMVPGAVQLPPDGQPVVLMANHATTGGYPVVAVVVEEDLDLLAQARPGRRIRLAPA